MGAVEDAMVRYVVRELDAGRPARGRDARIRTSPTAPGRWTARRLLDRPEVIAAVGEDVIDDLRAKLGLL